MRYVRARRLSEAARALRERRAPISSASRWMRTTALTKPSPARFRDHFGVTPESGARRRRASRQLKLQEPIIMDSTLLDTSQGRRVSRPGKPLLVAGIGERYNSANAAPAIPGQWQRFHQSVDSIPGRIGKVAYRRLLQRRRFRKFRLHRRRRGRRLLRPACREIRPRPDSRQQICGVHPRRAHLDHPPHRQHDLESLAAGVRDEGRRRAPNFERYDEKFDPVHRQWRARNLDTGEE